MHLLSLVFISVPVTPRRRACVGMISAHVRPSSCNIDNDIQVAIQPVSTWLCSVTCLGVQNLISVKNFMGSAIGEVISWGSDVVNVLKYSSSPEVLFT